MAVVVFAMVLVYLVKLTTQVVLQMLEYLFGKCSSKRSPKILNTERKTKLMAEMKFLDEKRCIINNIGDSSKESKQGTIGKNLEIRNVFPNLASLVNCKQCFDKVKSEAIIFDEPCNVLKFRECIDHKMRNTYES